MLGDSERENPAPETPQPEAEQPETGQPETGQPEAETVSAAPEETPPAEGVESEAPAVEADAQAEAETEAPPEVQPEPEPAAPEIIPGPHYGTGRRKASVARVYLRSGSGNVRVNGRPLDEFFTAQFWRRHAREPLEFLGLGAQFDAEVRVHGGGSTGQAGAIRMGLARALALANPAGRVRLRQAGYLTRDPRMKERQKPGQKGARKRFQWTKR